MKICVMSNALGVHTQRWARAYAERGHEVHLLSIRKADIPGVKVHTVCVGPLNSKSVLWTFLSYLRLMLAGRSRLKKMAPDVLHAHYAVTHGVIAAFSGFHPRAVSVWGKDVIWDKKGRMPLHLRFLLRLAFRNADLICSISRFMKQQTQQFVGPQQTIELVPWGVDCEKFKPADEKDTESKRKEMCIGFVKTFLPKYGPTVLARAMRQVVDAIPNARLIMAGQGPLMREVQELAHDLDLQDHIGFPGFVPNEEVPRLMQSFDVFVNCSVYNSESFGVAILEASACGLPVVVTDVGGVSETCKNRETGIMVEPNDPDALAAALIRLGQDPILAREMGRAGRKFVLETYIWQDNVDRMLGFLKRLISSGKRN